MRKKALLLVLAALPLTLPSTARAAELELISRVGPGLVSGTGAGAQGPGQGPDFFAPPPPSLSADGRYAVFTSAETNLAPGQRDGNGDQDVFLRDLVAGTTTLVSRAAGSTATTGNGRSGEAAISADGRWVVFTTLANDLVPGQTGFPFGADTADLLLYDRGTDTLSLIATRPFGDFRSPAISADGRWIAFASSAGELVPDSPAATSFNIFLYDRVGGSFRLASPRLPSSFGIEPALRPLISADGGTVAFLSSAGDLVPDWPGGESAYLYSRDTGLVTRAGEAGEMAMSADGRWLAFRSFLSLSLYDRIAGTRTLVGNATVADRLFSFSTLALSADGRWLALVSQAGQLSPAQPGGTAEGVYLYDRVTRAFTLVSRKHGSATAPALRTATPSISADGRFVAFLSLDTDLVTGQTDANATWDTFLFDRNGGTTTLLSHAASSATAAANAFSYSPGVSADGTRVAFRSLATNLVAGLADLNRGEDVFSWEIASASLSAVSRRAPDLPSLTPEGYSRAAALSAGGRWVAFESDSPHVIPGQTDADVTTDVFLFDRATGTTLLVSHAAGSATRTANRRSFAPALSADARWVLFQSFATDLAPGTPENESNASLFLFDRLAGTTVRVAPLQSADPGDAPFPQARITPDGRWVAFASSARRLAPGQQDSSGPTFDVFLWDRLTGSTTLVSHAASSPLRAGTNSYQPQISDDGRWIAYASRAANLVSGQADANRDPDLFLWDRTTGKSTLVSHVRGAPLTAGGIDPFTSDQPFAMSADGRFIAFGSTQGLIEPGVSFRLYLYDRASGDLQGIAPYTSLSEPRISADGRFVAFLQSSVPGFETGGHAQVFLYDRAARTTTLVSRSLTGDRGSNDDAFDLALSADGGSVAFASSAYDLVPGQPGPTPAVPFPPAQTFFWQRATGVTTLVSAPGPSSVRSGGTLGGHLLSANGRQLAFTTLQDLVEGDRNDAYDAYLFSLDPPPSGGPVTVPPCVLFDGAAQRSNVRKVLTVAGACGVPAGATRVTVQVTAQQGTALGNLRLYPGDVTAPPSGTLRFVKTQPASATFDLPLAANGTGTIAVLPFVRGNGTVRVTVEVEGYTP
jgi:Tol biopolymer transport system component